MRAHFVFPAIMAAVSGVVADLCASGSIEIAGNYYCQAVNAIKYANVGTPGSYNQITHMGSDGTCTSTSKAFSGALSPLDEEVSLHFRGPIHLKQFAVYTPSTSSQKKRDVSAARARRHAHGHEHKKFHDKRASKLEVADQVDKRGADEVYAVIDGAEVSWVNNYFGPSTANAAAGAISSSASTGGADAFVTYTTYVCSTPPSAVSTAAASASSAIAYGAAASLTGGSTAASAISSPDSYQSSRASASKTASASASASSSASMLSSGSYERVGYYDATSQTLDGLVFLNNRGGQGSGVFDYSYGSSLSYMDASGVSGAASAQILGDGVVPSNNEFSIFSDTPCTDGSCGYVRPGTIAYHGFGGADKIFLAELQMPSDPTSSAAMNADMPAFWMLNAQIPRTLQYGNADCSCWQSGCGEFDILEVLSPASDKCKSTFHMNVAGGDSDYFQRPTTQPIKVAVVFDAADASAHILLLNDDATFDASLDGALVRGLLQNLKAQGAVSEFALA